jgi:hypothetical protein
MANAIEEINKGISIVRDLEEDKRKCFCLIVPKIKKVK